MSLTREQILRSANPPPESVQVPEWGGVVYVRVMTGTERDAYETAVLTDRDTRLENMRAKLVARTTADEAGNLIFTPDDVAEIGKKSWLPLQRITAVAQRINMLSDEALENIKGNSEPSLGAEQSSDSR